MTLALRTIRPDEPAFYKRARRRFTKSLLSAPQRARFRFTSRDPAIRLRSPVAKVACHSIAVMPTSYGNTTVIPSWRRKDHEH